MSIKVVAVSALLTRIKQIVTSTVILDGIWIRGEVSNLTKHRSGHYYFSLKDHGGEMSCVMFASAVGRMNFALEEGMQILVLANVNIYEARGSLQLYVKEIRMHGIGKLYQEFEARKQKLEQEGYFALAHKKTKPSWINDIAIITAKEGAALQDVLSTIQKRWPMAKPTLYPALTQGINAPASLIKALKRADQNGHDALLLVRGGGSFEDLFCFNDVELVKTIYGLKTYIVCGTGHEVDTTLAELASDQRVATPTAAAQFVTLDQYDMLNRLSQERAILIQRMQDRLSNAQMHLVNIQSNPYFLDPLQWVEQKKIRLSHALQLLDHTLKRFMDQRAKQLTILAQNLLLYSPQNTIRLKKQTLEQTVLQFIAQMKDYDRTQRNLLSSKEALLDAFSPLKVLARGYSIVEKEGSLVLSVQDVHEDETIDILMGDGKLKAKVFGKEYDNV
ncbi:exodeoxyribonuclease VII large subunit [Dubosiella newyorkensis]|uniref:exodeoxyribonuclease VII large subunit n=1 Tax=Dubosiella newyorkensis TaxID=1862672 RepID=UPI002729536B|nr:exodeoxyribonuclease VII large subunit [Dubosiella newyorkensis]